MFKKIIDGLELAPLAGSKLEPTRYTLSTNFSFTLASPAAVNKKLVNILVLRHLLNIMSWL